MNDIFDQIKQNSNNPTQTGGAQTGADLFHISEEDAEKRREWTNNCELLALCAKGPNNNQYALDVLGLKSVPATTEGYKGQNLEIKRLEKPSVPYDGYQISTPDGTIEIPKDKALAWLLNNTLGRIRGGKKGRVLIAETPKTQSLTNKKAIKAVAKKISASNPDDVIQTWTEKKTSENGEPLTHRRTVALKVDVPDGQKAPNVRGAIEDFPIFIRKPEFINSLGSITTSSSSAVSSVVNKGREQEQAIAELKRLMSVAHSDNIEF